MFEYADKDGDGKLSYGEFLMVINPPKADKENEHNLIEKVDKHNEEIREDEVREEETGEDGEDGEDEQVDAKEEVKVVTFDEEVKEEENPAFHEKS